jgi:hypothetical protein
MRVKKRLGEILLERGLIDLDQLNSALAHQRQWGMRLGTALVAKGFIVEGVLTRVLSESLGIPMVDLARIQPEPKALQMLNGTICEQHDVFPIALKEQKGRKVLLLAMADPLNATVIDEIAFTQGCIVKPAIAQISSLGQAIRRYYHAQRVEISPLSFEKTSVETTMRRPSVGGEGERAHPKIGGDDEPMTIITSGGKEELVVGNRGAAPIVQLTEEVTERTALAEIQREHAKKQNEDAAVYQGQAFSVVPHTDPNNVLRQPTTGEVLATVRAADLEAVEALEKKFWALMRVLARKGMITKDEFLNELRGVEENP